MIGRYEYPFIAHESNIWSIPTSQDNNNVLDRLKLWICSGETLSVALADQFFSTFGDDGKILANFYGSTEVMGDVTYHLLNKRTQLRGMEKIPIGKNHFFLTYIYIYIKERAWILLILRDIRRELYDKVYSPRVQFLSRLDTIF